MRIRSTKPEFWSSEDVAALSWETRLIFLGLWSYVDDNSVGRDNPKLIMADLFPLEDDPRETLAKVSRGLDELSNRGLIYRYTDPDGRPLLCITGWKHQRIDKPSTPRYPLPTSENANPRETLASPPETLAPGTEEQRNRGTEEKVKSTSADASLIPPPPTQPDAFNEFWRTYPRSEDRPKALTAWNRHVIKAKINPRMVIAAAQRYRDDPNRDPGFTKHAATWLNNACWENGPLPPRGSPPRQLSTNQRFGAAWEANAQAIDQQTAARQIGA